MYTEVLWYVIPLVYAQLAILVFFEAFVAYKFKLGRSPAKSCVSAIAAALVWPLIFPAVVWALFREFISERRDEK